MTHFTACTHFIAKTSLPVGMPKAPRAHATACCLPPEACPTHHQVLTTAEGPATIQRILELLLAILEINLENLKEFHLIPEIQ